MSKLNGFGRRGASSRSDAAPDLVADRNGRHPTEPTFQDGHGGADPRGTGTSFSLSTVLGLPLGIKLALAAPLAVVAVTALQGMGAVRLDALMKGTTAGCRGPACVVWRSEATCPSAGAHDLKEIFVWAANRDEAAEQIARVTADCSASEPAIYGLPVQRSGAERTESEPREAVEVSDTD